MKQFDAIIIFGSKPDTSTWKFPSHVYKSLDKAIELYAQGIAPYIVLSGKWALVFDSHHLHQPYLECDKMAEYLIDRGVPKEAILKEGWSKDTVSNLYFVKRKILQPRHFNRLLIVAAEFREQRIAFLWQKILGPAYRVTFETVEALPEEIYPNEADTLYRTLAFLEQMTDGDEHFLDDKFYSASYYHPT